MQATSMPKTPTEYPETQVTPDPELERRTRRVFTADYKLRIIPKSPDRGISAPEGRQYPLISAWLNCRQR